ncbi:HAMP domain-containing protein [Rahnella sp. L72c]|uniref:HAMP domain-containing protein n=1 Tax=Rahnella perminowiae TaxID=2816244 RepID=A0ABS6KYQ8_9GAMM|nr:methyl-accepting chemotaxis protein [Rahnella perminowiae]MBU9834659.1 HAMP domain-containing protein [Rahnella perminowiae]
MFNNLAFGNFSIGKKLFSGFIVLIIIISGISLYSIYSFKIIQANAEKTEVVNKIGHLLDIARRNRLLFQQTGDEQAMKANGDAINNMQSLTQKEAGAPWQGQIKNKFDVLVERLNNYKQLRETFLDKSLRSQALAKELNPAAGQPYLLDLQKNMLSASLEPDAHEKLLEMSLAIAFLQNAGNNFIASPTSENFTHLQKSYRAADALYSTLIVPLPDADKSVVTPAWTYFKKMEAVAEAYYSATPETKRAADEMGKGAEALNAATLALIEVQGENNQKVIADTIVIISALAAAAIIMALLSAGFITRQITRPIIQNLTLAERIASGDLTAEVSSDSMDELGKLTRTMGAMNARLCDMITGIRESVSHLASASSQIAVGNTDLASRTEQQSAAVVETASSMEELTSTVRMNADNALQASKLAASATQDAVRGGEIVSKVVLTMNGIADSSKKITDIISVINGIAFQTNILALNAAVEAARAGEQGRGFAVVAGEVRTLAQRSANAAKEIEALINESVVRIGTGTELVSRAGASMQDIVQSVTHVSQIIDEISTSSNEQSQGIEQIGKAVTEMDSTTQQNATLVQESSAAAISLEQQAKKLSDMVAVFKVKALLVNENASDILPASAKKRRPALSAATNTSLNDDWTSF